MFITHLILQWYSGLRNFRNKRFVKKYSVRDVIDVLLDIKKVRINGLWYNTKVTSKTERIIKLLEVKF